jgi:mono/diheme cytochrome c family protein
MSVVSRRLIVFASTAAAALAIVAILLNRTPSSGPTIPVDVRMPARLSALAAEGRDLFASTCAGCHGERAAGTDRGPPLVHVIYEPNHHADIAFFLAVRNGVRAHHWTHGNMPPLSHVSESDVGKMVRYVRELQLANGIGASHD